MDDGRLFDVESLPEVPIFREPRRAKAARGSVQDARFRNDYPADWHRCSVCGGGGILLDDVSVESNTVEDGLRTVQVVHVPTQRFGNATQSDTIRSGIELRAAAVAALRYDLHANAPEVLCPACRGMGSWKGMARRLAEHRCERCLHPYMPKGDARMIGVAPTPFQWSPCDERCTHGGPVRYRETNGEWVEIARGTALQAGIDLVPRFAAVESEWRILTVHHLDGDKANCAWWNLASLCQRCHLEIQAKVVLERVYPHEHSEWFRLHAAGWYAWSYLGESLTREATIARLDELLDLERTPA